MMDEYVSVSCLYGVAGSRNKFCVHPSDPFAYILNFNKKMFLKIELTTGRREWIKIKPTAKTIEMASISDLIAVIRSSKLFILAIADDENKPTVVASFYIDTANEDISLIDTQSLFNRNISDACPYFYKDENEKLYILPCFTHQTDVLLSQFEIDQNGKITATKLLQLPSLAGSWRSSFIHANFLYFVPSAFDDKNKILKIPLPKSNFQEINVKISLSNSDFQEITVKNNVDDWRMYRCNPKNWSKPLFFNGKIFYYVNHVGSKQGCFLGLDLQALFWRRVLSNMQDQKCIGWPTLAVNNGVVYLHGSCHLINKSCNKMNEKTQIYKIHPKENQTMTNFAFHDSKDGNLMILNQPLTEMQNMIHQPLATKRNIVDKVGFLYSSANINQNSLMVSRNHLNVPNSQNRCKKTDLRTLINLDKKVEDEIRFLELPEEIDGIGQGCSCFVYTYKMRNGAFVAGKNVILNLFNINAEEKKNLQEHLNLALNEILVLRQLDHENVVKFYGCFWDTNQLIIFEELMSESIKAKINNDEAPLSEKECVNYSRQAANGLNYLHSLRPKAVVHRDVKCDNLLLNEQGTVKLTDFGISYHLAINSASMTRFSSAPHSLAGTYRFMAPEVLRDMDNSDAYGRKSDIWSLGCTMVEMLRCSPPFHEMEPMKFIQRATTAEHWQQYKGESLLPTASGSIHKLLNCLFVVDQQKRPSIKKVLHIIRGMERNELSGLMELHDTLFSK